jgi:putative redox protein
MVTIDVQYEGDLHCTCTHGPSKTTLATDAPVDNHGRGESFSPTDLLATSLASCVLTTMAISARKHGIELTGAKAQVIKEMSTTSPRRVAKLTLALSLPNSIPEDKRPALEAAIKGCPVHHSLHPDIVTPVTVAYI